MGDGIAYDLVRVRTRDGDETTVYLVRHPAATTRVSVLRFREPTRLDHWCAATGRPEAMVAGFFVRDPYRPLGEVRIAGTLVEHEPVPAPWAAARACVHVDGSVRLARRDELGADPAGDLVQAGPMLVRDGRVVVDEADEEGFSTGAAQFDSDSRPHWPDRSDPRLEALPARLERADSLSENGRRAGRQPLA